MFGIGFCYPSSGGLPLLPAKSICLAMNPVTFGSEGCGPSQNPRVCLSQPQRGSASSTPAPLSASSCFLTGDSCVSQTPSPALPRGACCPESSWPGTPWAGRAAGPACCGQGGVSSCCKVVALLVRAFRDCENSSSLWGWGGRRA